jgi:hypothetical protein
MTHKPLNKDEKLALNEWYALCERIENTTGLSIIESESDKINRIKRLKNNFEEFCKYYFGNFIDCNFGWFHKKAAKEITQNKDIIAVLEWPREHAKSVFGIVFMPIYLYARGECDGMIVISSTNDKAKTLLGDLQAQFVANQRLKEDFGNLVNHGDWQNGEFSLTTGEGFWAVGRGQSPRGLRKGQKRPNCAGFDDVDDDELCQNETRVDKTVAWAKKSVYPALPLKGKRIWWMGNRIARKSVLAKIVGDYDAGLEVDKGILHIKVYALENSKSHAKADFATGVPAWKERYTKADFELRRKEMGTLFFNAEYMHEHLVSGKHFKPEWWHYMKTPPLSHFDCIVNYTDSSMGAAKTSDYKASITLGALNPKYNYPYKYHVLDNFCRQCTNNLLVKYLFDLHDKYGASCEFWVEANKLQKHSSWKLLKQDFDAEAKKRNIVDWQPRGDERDKPKKEMRIESLIGLFERGLISWALEKRSSTDFQTGAEQFWAYPEGHDDEPDAFEGAMEKIQKKQRGSGVTNRMGKYVTNNNRRI